MNSEYEPNGGRPVLREYQTKRYTGHGGNISMGAGSSASPTALSLGRDPVTRLRKKRK